MIHSRRDFLHALAGLGAGAAAAGVGAHLSGRRDTAAAGTDAVRTIHLETREVTWELAPGKTIRAMAYNGHVPGPSILAREGKRLRVVLKNSHGKPTTIHWHGVDVPNPMDGVPGITQKAVQPGETFVYEFEARPVGTRCGPNGIRTRVSVTTTFSQALEVLPVPASVTPVFEASPSADRAIDKDSGSAYGARTAPKVSRTGQRRSVLRRRSRQ